MSLLARSVTSMHRWSNPIAALLLLSAAGSTQTAQADPADFQAMPGLWKITLHTLRNGHADQVVKWKCLYDGADPWTTFVDVMTPDPACQRSGEHRTSTALAWNVSCGERAGRGHIALDSAEHYSGGVALNGQDVMQIDGKRYAACTGPSD